MLVSEASFYFSTSALRSSTLQRLLIFVALNICLNLVRVFTSTIELYDEVGYEALLLTWRILWIVSGYTYPKKGPKKS